MQKLLITAIAGIMAVGLLAQAPAPATPAHAKAPQKTARHEQKKTQHAMHVNKKVHHKSHKKDAGAARTQVPATQTPTK
jgi:hypothetical protein